MPPSLSLTDLPYEVVFEKIVQELDISSRLCLRKCSKDLRYYVDKTKIVYNKIGVELERSSVSLIIETDNDKLKIVYPEEKKLYQIDVPYDVERLVPDFVSIAIGPNVTVKVLRFSIEILMVPSSDTKNRILNKFCSAIGTRAIQAEMLDFYGRDCDCLTVLSFLKPGTLHRLFLASRGFMQMASPQLTATEQWKQAKWLDNKWDCVPFEQLTHFTYATIRSHTITVEDVRLLIQAAIAHGEDFISYKIDMCRVPSEVRKFVNNSPYSQPPVDQRVVGQVYATASLTTFLVNRHVIGRDGNYNPVRSLSDFHP